jgi:hypothetical protein
MSGGGRMVGRGIFDKDVRRKPLALAADATDAYGDCMTFLRTTKALAGWRRGHGSCEGRLVGGG